MVHNFRSPLYVMLPRKTKADKKVYLNLNTYRNLHYQINNQAKAVYKEYVRDQLEGKKFQTPIIISFTLFKASARTQDKSNVLSIVEKFFCDALTELGCIPDDNDSYIGSTHYYNGGVDREDARVEITIEEATP